MKQPRVLLADDHLMLLSAFEKLLEGRCEIIGTVGDGRALLAKALALTPDIIVLDISMPLLNGLEAARQIKATLPRVKLIFLTVNEDPELVAEAFEAGASAYLLKNSAATELFKAIDRVQRGCSYVTPLIATEGEAPLPLRPEARRPSAKLTPRQREVLQLLAEGHSMKEAARILEVSPRTIAFHKYRMMDELRVKTSAELVQFAVREQIVSP